MSCCCSKCQLLKNLINYKSVVVTRAHKQQKIMSFNFINCINNLVNKIVGNPQWSDNTHIYGMINQIDIPREFTTWFISFKLQNVEKCCRQNFYITKFGYLFSIFSLYEFFF